jgi:DNA segregation ATPase FtsK/SpoIIIE, S-DNA-T family
VFGLATAMTLVLAASVPRRARKSVAREIDEADEIDEDETADDQGSAWLGMIVHALLSWKARIGRMIRGESRARTPIPLERGARQEPRFEGHGQDEDEYEDEDEEDTEEAAPRRRAVSRSPRRSGSGYALPSLSLLAAPRASERTTLSRDIIDANAVALESVLQDFGVRGEIINARPGPVVTLYELEPARDWTR